MGEKLDIIAEEIEYVYLIEVDVLHAMLESEHFKDIRRKATCLVHDETKMHCRNNKVILYLTRRFLAGFMSKSIPARLRTVLDESFGNDQWCVRTRRTTVEFKNGTQFERTIPFNFIGRPATRAQIRVPKKVKFDMTNLT